MTVKTTNNIIEEQDITTEQAVNYYIDEIA